MNFRNSLLAIAFLVTQISLAQSIITGKIVDENNMPIALANVMLLDKGSEKTGTTSDDEGSFELQINDKGNFKLYISYIGFTSIEKEIDLTTEQTIDLGKILLEQSLESLQSVEIIGRKRQDYVSDYSFSATKIAIKNKELPQAVATVTKELIADRQAFQLTDAVKTVSNVAITGLYNHYNIRGITQGDDGQVLNGMRTRQYYFLQPITSHLERVEVIKGPSSVTFSSADPGGTVNIVTKKPLTKKYREVSLTTGSFGTLRATADFTGPLNDEKTLLYRFNAAYQEADSFRDVVNSISFLVTPSLSYIPNKKTALNVEMIYNIGDGNLDRGQPIFDAVDEDYDPNSTPISLNPGAIDDFYKTKEIVFMASFSKKFTESFGFNAQFMKQTWDEDLQEHRIDAFNQPYDINGGVLPDLVALRYAERQQFWETDNLSAFFNYDIKNDNFTNKALIGYDGSRWERKVGGQNSSRRYLLNDGTLERFIPGTSNPDDFQQTADGLLVPAVPHFNLTDPFNGIRNTNDYVLAQTQIPANLTSSDGVYFQNHFKLGKFSALLNLRYEWFEDIFDYEGDEQKFKKEAFIPRIGATYEVTDDISVYTTYLEGFQPHTNTVSLSPSAEGFFWTASPGRFDPLESSLIEFGAKSSFFNGKLSANMAIFEITQKNILLGDTFNLDNLTTRGEQGSRGFEIDVAGYIIPNLQITASYGYNDAIIIDDSIEDFIGQRIGGAPKNNANFWARYDCMSGIFKGLGLGFGAQYVDERFTWYNPTYLADRVLLPEYTVFDAALYYKPNNTGIQLAIKLNNLENKKYWLGGLNPSRLGPGAPRNILLNATYKF
ncbi:TonB-dependent receptor [Aquimarina agarivorans]|uniref:TonB-dependent receptor n=1 Tax=Aquimarina agarivorans TaxID=980584 RepID=UPI000248FAB1|nr:TonB-dependent receptor [Aquimarina agarivorans]